MEGIIGLKFETDSRIVAQKIVTGFHKKIQKNKHIQFEALLTI